MKVYWRLDIYLLLCGHEWITNKNCIFVTFSSRILTRSFWITSASHLFIINHFHFLHESILDLCVAVGDFNKHPTDLSKEDIYIFKVYLITVYDVMKLNFIKKKLIIELKFTDIIKHQKITVIIFGIFQYKYLQEDKRTNFGK